MNMQIVKGSMKELKGDLKQTWSKLTDDDINYLDGNVDEIIGKVQRAYGFTRERANEEFLKFKNKHANYFRDDRDFNTKERKMATPLNGSVNPSLNSNVRSNMNSFMDEDMMDASSEYMDKVRQMGSVAMERSTDFIRTYPGYTLLGAAGIGFILGALFSRRS